MILWQLHVSVFSFTFLFLERLHHFRLPSTRHKTSSFIHIKLTESCHFMVYP